MASEVRSTVPGPGRKEHADHLSLHAARAGRECRILTRRSGNQRVGVMLVYGHRISYRAISLRMPVCGTAGSGYRSSERCRSSDLRPE